MSAVDASIRPLKATFANDKPAEDSQSNKAIIDRLGLLKHTEGGYFGEIDRNPLIIPNPFLTGSTQAPTSSSEAGRTALVPRSGNDTIRNASTSIYYFLTPSSPQGAFHRNKGRTVHTLIRGRGQYVIIHADEEGEKKRVETFTVGRDIERGERTVWVVEGGKFKASFLLEGDGDGLLISETVIPGFEYSDHDFLTAERFRELVTGAQADELRWLLRKGPPPKESELL